MERTKSQVRSSGSLLGERMIFSSLAPPPNMHTKELFSCLMYCLYKTNPSCFFIFGSYLLAGPAGTWQLAVLFLASADRGGGESLGVEGGLGVPSSLHRVRGSLLLTLTAHARVPYTLPFACCSLELFMTKIVFRVTQGTARSV